MTLGRIVSIAADGAPGGFVWMLLAGELVIAAAAWLLMLSGKSFDRGAGGEG